jgi:hypothetical protein
MLWSQSYRNKIINRIKKRNEITLPMRNFFLFSLMSESTKKKSDPTNNAPLATRTAMIGNSGISAGTACAGSIRDRNRSKRAIFRKIIGASFIDSFYFKRKRVGNSMILCSAYISR